MPNCEITVLLVEDNDLDAEYIIRVFRRLNVEKPTQRARNGGEALDILRDNHASGADGRRIVVLLDLNMPRVNGLEFLAELRSDERIANTPIIVLTTSDAQRDVDDAHAFNISGYIVKPVSPEAFVKAISTANDYWNLVELPQVGNG